MDHAIAAVAYDGRPDGLVFAVGDKRIQYVYVRNCSARYRVMTKIQSTSSRKFRVRPSFAVLGPHESVAVQIQLAPSERDASECKFLLVVRRVSIEEESSSVDVVTTRRGSTAAEQAQQQRETEEKQLWQRAEAQQNESLVLSEPIVAHIVAGANGELMRVAPLPLPPLSVSLPRGDTTATIQPAEAPLPRLELRIDSEETRAQVVALLMRSQSRLPPNQLTVDQRAALRRLRDAHATEWPALEGDARRMRALARQFMAAQRRQREEAT